MALSAKLSEESLNIEEAINKVTKINKLLKKKDKPFIIDIEAFKNEKNIILSRLR